MPSVIIVKISDGFIPSVMFPRETFFLARAYPSVRPSVGVFFLFATELVTDLPTTGIPMDVFRRDFFHRRIALLSPTELVRR
jgi:hypothetical protein